MRVILLILLYIKGSSASSGWPMAEVSGQESGDVTTLLCQVSGFSSQPASVTWMRNGIERMSTGQSILPNSQGTFKTSASVDVKIIEEETYACHVDHSSLEETFIVLWGPKSGEISPGNLGTTVILGIVIPLTVLLLSLGVFLAVRYCWRKRRNLETAYSCCGGTRLSYRRQ